VLEAQPAKLCHQRPVVLHLGVFRAIGVAGNVLEVRGDPQLRGFPFHGAFAEKSDDGAHQFSVRVVHQGALGTFADGVAEACGGVVQLAGRYQFTVAADAEEFNLLPPGALKPCEVEGLEEAVLWVLQRELFEFGVAEHGELQGGGGKCSQGVTFFTNGGWQRQAVGWVGGGWRNSQVRPA
jgi:hypothetical protein